MVLYFKYSDGFSALYLKDAKNIVAGAEVYLKRSIRNEDLLNLINLQKTFVIFAHEQRL